MQDDGASSDGCSCTMSGSQRLLLMESEQVADNRQQRVSVYSSSAGVARAAGSLLSSSCSMP